MKERVRQEGTSSSIRKEKGKKRKKKKSYEEQWTKGKVTITKTRCNWTQGGNRAVK